MSLEILDDLEKVSKSIKVLHHLMYAPGAVMVNPEDLKVLYFKFCEAVAWVEVLRDEAEMLQDALDTANEGYRRALKEAGELQWRLEGLSK